MLTKGHQRSQACSSLCKVSREEIIWREGGQSQSTSLYRDNIVTFFYGLHHLMPLVIFLAESIGLNKRKKVLSNRYSILPATKMVLLPFTAVIRHFISFLRTYDGSWSDPKLYFPLPFPLLRGDDRVCMAQWTQSPLFNPVIWLTDF